MRFLRFNTLSHCIFLATGLGATGSVWAQDTADNPLTLPVIQVEATRTGTTYLQTPASIFRVDAPAQQ